MIHDTGHAIAFHIDASPQLTEVQAGSREGIWWLPKETTNEYLILTNQGNTALSLALSLYDSTGRESKQQLPLGPYSTTRLSVRNLLQAAGLTGSYGGIQVSAAAHAGSLDTLHFLFDKDANFSALLKMFDHFPNAGVRGRQPVTPAKSLRALSASHKILPSASRRSWTSPSTSRRPRRPAPKPKRCGSRPSRSRRT